jgi:transcriptional antiterminator
MAKDLTSSAIERQNVLNNPYALEEIQKATRIECIVFEGKAVLLKEQVAEFFQVTTRTIDNYIAKFEGELRQNGYDVLRGNRLKSFKISISELPGNEINFITKTTVLGIFDFRSFLNLAMLITEYLKPLTSADWKVYWNTSKMMNTTHLLRTN